MGRPTSLTKPIQEEICKYLRLGVTVENICNYVGIADRTYYLWLAIGRACDSGEEHQNKPKTAKAQEPYLQFFQAVTRAQAEAHVNAVIALRGGMTAAITEEEWTETFSETRIRKGKDGESVPYTYARTKKTVKVIHHPPDPRIALEFLKRRDPRNWSDRITLDDDRSLAIKDIRAGVLSYEALVEAGGYEFAAGLFAEAGVPIPHQESKD